MKDALTAGFRANSKSQLKWSCNKSIGINIYVEKLFAFFLTPWRVRDGVRFRCVTCKAGCYHAKDENLVHTGLGKT